MKKLILITILFILILSPNLFSDTFYVSANTGNDSNDGTSWANAWLTLGQLNGNISAGDSAILVGDFTEEWAPNYDGTSGNKVVHIDSVRFEDGFSLTVPDTTWSAIVDADSTRNRALLLSGDEFLDFVGIQFQEAILTQVQINSTGNDNLFLQCRLFLAGDASMSALSIAGLRDTVISTLFLETSAGNTQTVSFSSTSDGIYFINNTLKQTATAQDQIGINSGSGSGHTLRNNLFEGTNVNDIVDLRTPTTSILVFNNNLYFDTDASTSWDFGAAGNITAVSVWADSVDNYDTPNGGDSSLDTDAVLQSDATTAFILNTSAAAEAGVDLGYGNDIGYFQTAPDVGRRRSKIIGALLERTLGEQTRNKKTGL